MKFVGQTESTSPPMARPMVIAYALCKCWLEISATLRYLAMGSHDYVFALEALALA